MERKLNNSFLLAVIASVCILLFANHSWGGSSSRGGHYGHSIRPINGHHGYYKYGHGNSNYKYRHGKKHRYNKQRYGHSIRPMNDHHGYYKYGHGNSNYKYRHGKKHRYNKQRYGKMPYNYRPKYGGRITSNFNKDYNGRDKGDKKNLEHTYKHGNKKHKNSKANEENYKEELIEKDWFR
jgi:hypothetical protein